MKRVLFAVAAAGALAIAIPAAAQTSADVNARQAMLDARINQGVQNRTLTVAEAAALRAQFNDIANLEVRYRDSDGLQTPELIDLDRRLAGLEGQIRVQRADAQYGPGYGAGAGQSIDQRQAALENRIDQGVRNGSLTTEEVQRLRAEFRDLANIEARYRADGTLGTAQRPHLDRRFDALSNRIRIEQADSDVSRPGYDNRGWQPINQRQAAIDARIDQGIRNGALTANEALQLRTEFRGIVNLEAQYRATGGLQGWEQADLDRRLDQLNTRVRIERADNQRAGQPWQSMYQRQAVLDRRIDQGVRDGSLSRSEAMRLRAEFQRIVQTERRYRANGLQSWERVDLDRRFDRLSAQIRVARDDGQGRDYDRRDGRGVGYNAGAR